MSKDPKSLFDQLSKSTRLGVAVLLANTDSPQFRNLLRDIPADPYFNGDFTLGEVVPVVLMHQLQNQFLLARDKIDQKSSHLD